MVIPRSFSSFALSIWSKGVNGLRSGYLSCSTLGIAAVSVVLPWSMCPMVPMLTCGLVRSNLAFATGVSLLSFKVRVVHIACLVPAVTLRTSRSPGRTGPGFTSRYVNNPPWLRSAPPRWGRAPPRGAPPFLTSSCCLLAAGLRDDLLGNAGRHLGVRVELHGVVRPALGPAPQVTHVAEHLGQRDERLDDPGAGALLHGLDLATAAVQITDHVAHVLVGGPDLDGHDRLEQHGVSLRGGLLEGHRAGDLEGQLRGVHLVVGAVGQRDLDIDDRVPGEHPEFGGFLAPGVDRGDVLARDVAAGHLVLELVA